MTGRLCCRPDDEGVNGSVISTAVEARECRENNDSGHGNVPCCAWMGELYRGGCSRDLAERRERGKGFDDGKLGGVDIGNKRYGTGDVNDGEIPSVFEYVELFEQCDICEMIMGAVSIAVYKGANQEALEGNEFNFEPIKEVVFLFIGIFMAMISALEPIEAYAATHAAELSLTRMYWMAGMLSGVLDNAPT